MISPRRVRLDESFWVLAETVDNLRDQGLTYPEMTELIGRPATDLIKSHVLACRVRDELERLVRCPN